MRRTRHVVLPVRSWQYTGLMVVSLACLTLGLVSRDREGRSGSLAGPELKHTAPHEVDACPNIDPFTRLPHYDETASQKMTTNRMSTLSRVANPNQRVTSLDQYAESTWVKNERKNHARHRESTNTDRRARSIDPSRIRDDRSSNRRTNRRTRLFDPSRVRDDRSNSRVTDHRARSTDPSRVRDDRSNSRLADHSAQLADSSRVRDDRSNRRLTNHRARSTNPSRVRDDPSNSRLTDHSAQMTDSSRVRDDRSNSRLTNHRARSTNPSRVRDDPSNSRLTDHSAQMTDSSRVRDDRSNSRLTDHRARSTDSSRVRDDRSNRRLTDHRARSIDPSRVREDRSNSRLTDHRAQLTDSSRVRDDRSNRRLTDHRARSIDPSRVREDRSNSRLTDYRAQLTDSSRVRDHRSKSRLTDYRARSTDSSRVRDDRSNRRLTDHRARSIDPSRVREDRSNSRLTDHRAQLTDSSRVRDDRSKSRLNDHRARSTDSLRVRDDRSNRRLTDHRARSIDPSRVREDRSNSRLTDHRTRSTDALRVRDDRSNSKRTLARSESLQFGKHQHSLSREKRTFEYERQGPIMSRSDDLKSIREATRSQSYEKASVRTDAQYGKDIRTNELSGRFLSKEGTRSDQLVLTSRSDSNNSLYHNRRHWHIRSTIDHSRRNIRMMNLRTTDSMRAEHQPREDVRRAVVESGQAGSSRGQRNHETLELNARNIVRSHSNFNQRATSQRSRMIRINRKSSNTERLQIHERTSSRLHRRESGQRGPSEREINRNERLERPNDISATSRRVRLSQSRDVDHMDNRREGIRYDGRKSMQQPRINPTDRRERRIDDILTISRNNQRHQFSDQIRERTSRASHIITRESEERSSLNRHELTAPVVLRRLSELRNIDRESSRKERSSRYRYSDEREHRRERRIVVSTKSRYTQRLQSRNDVRLVEEERKTSQRPTINRVERLDKRINIVAKSTPANFNRLDVTKVRDTNVDNSPRREARSVELRDEETSRMDSQRRNLSTWGNLRQIVRFDGKSYGRNFVQADTHREEAARAYTRQDRNTREVERVDVRRKHVTTVEVVRKYRMKGYPEVRDERREIDVIGVPTIQQLVSKTEIPYDLLRQTLILALCAMYGASLANRKGNSYWNNLTQTRRLVAW